jgi:helix-turn-helix protein
MVGWFKVKNAAKYADYSERTVRDWLRSGLRHSKLKSGAILIKVEWIDEWLEGHEVVENEVDQITDEIVKEMIKE